MKSRTNEGLEIILSISFQYVLNPNKLYNLYQLTNINYRKNVERISRDVILKEAGNYKAEQYWYERKVIGQKMKKSLNETLVEKTFAE